MRTHLYELVRERAAAYPSATALGAQEGLGWHTLTSLDLLALTDRLADELAAIGIGDGDRVVLWAPSHWRTPVYLFALWKLGAIVVPFDREMNPVAAETILGAVEPRCILVGYGERPVWAGERTITEWWEPGSRGGTPAASWARPAEELAAVVFTSGTTGSPKGCSITHANLCSQVDGLRHAMPLDPSCRLASILPLSHLFELTAGLLYPLSTGAAIHYVPSRRGPDIVRVFAEQRITHMLAVPQLLTLMGQALDEQLRARLPAPVCGALAAVASRLPLAARHRLYWLVHRNLGGQLRLMASGGAALPAETQRLWERLGVRIVQGYGTSECSPVIACGVADGSTPVGSVGKPLPDVEVRLNEAGEALVRGPNVMRGYWQDPERTAEVLADGWYATGDLATIDANGNIWLAGRARDLIVLPSGLNVWPQDVEDALRADPAVKDAAVIAVPTTSGGATLHAYLIPANARDGATDPSALVARCNGHLAQHQRLATASWWNEADFPRTSTLKVRRNLLPLPESIAAVAVNSALAGDDPVGQAIAGAARVSALPPDQTLGGLGLDSLGMVNLALALEEKTGRVVGDGDLRLEMTVEQVRALVAAAPATDGDRAGGKGAGFGGSGGQPLWPYTWGRALRFLGAPFELLYRLSVTRTIVLGGAHLADLPPRVIFAGTHHSYADMPLVRHGLAQTPARRFARRLVIATAGEHMARQGRFGFFGMLAFGLYPLRQFGERAASLRGLARLARANNAVLIFPQGVHADPTQERAGDPAARFRPGVAVLAEALDAVVVPFGLAGTETMMPPDAERFQGRVIGGIPVQIRRGPLAIAFGAPLRLEAGETPDAFAARLQAVCYPLTRDAEQAVAAAQTGPPTPDLAASTGR